MSGDYVTIKEIVTIRLPRQWGWTPLARRWRHMRQPESIRVWQIVWFVVLRWGVIAGQDVLYGSTAGSQSHGRPNLLEVSAPLLPMRSHHRNGISDARILYCLSGRWQIKHAWRLAKRFLRRYLRGIWRYRCWNRNWLLLPPETLVVKAVSSVYSRQWRRFILIAVPRHRRLTCAPCRKALEPSAAICHALLDRAGPHQDRFIECSYRMLSILHQASHRKKQRWQHGFLLDG